MKKRAIFWALFVSIGSALPVFSQVDPQESQSHVLVKWSPLSMWDIDNTIMFGLEVPLGKQISIQQDIGWGSSKFNVWYYDWSERPDKITYKSRTQFKYYFVQKPRWRSYIAGEFMYKKVIYEDNQWVGVGCEDGNCEYYTNKNIKQGRFVSAMHSKIGWQFYFSNRTTIDVFTGVGLRYIKSRMITQDVGNVGLGEDWFFWESNYPGGPTQTVPSFQVGFQIGIALGKFNKD